MSDGIESPAGAEDQSGIETNIAEIRELIDVCTLLDAAIKCRATLAPGVDARLLLLQGFVAEQIDRYDVPIRSGTHASGLGHEDWSNYFVLSNCLRTLGRHAEAQAALTKAYEMAPMRVDVAVVFLEETTVTAGFCAANDLYRTLSAQIKDPSFNRVVAPPDGGPGLYGV